MSPAAWKWVLFNLFVIGMLVVDLGVFHRRQHAIRLKEALGWSAFWIVLALLFNLGILFWYQDPTRPHAALEFLTGYLIEKSLSVDNLFVFLLIFSYFRVPAEYQHKVLFWGILGALVMRLAFILTGVALIHRFEWVIYIFGLILIVSGVKMALEKTKEIHPERNPVLRLFCRFMPVSDRLDGPRFLTRQAGRRVATPLLVVLLVVETTDVVFAVDSIPAVLAITTDPFIVYTSNVFAILGLRALYFALAGVMDMFHYLHYGLSAILVFVGLKMLVSHFYQIPIGIALGVVGLILLLSVIISVIWPEKKNGATGS
ncbi:TerC family protein [bacterium]|nr:TerC family protein [bacterium]